jgi:ketosteroid isomerase-like protein
LQIVTNAYGALAKGDINTFLGMLDEEVEWHLPEHHPLWPGKAFVGQQAVLEGHSLESVKSMTDSGSISSEPLRLATRCWSRCGVEARGR